MIGLLACRRIGEGPLGRLVLSVEARTGSFLRSLTDVLRFLVNLARRPALPQNCF